ncbi:HNH endonuclease [Streptomyces sp. NBC_00080]|uniref:HNH endonuclease n=1 Tax=unclassified Streptomyces TaxID=2593676 RepID=UPI001F285FB2|nr:HNH endonuclease [Streptomyces sp. SLBN-115]
MGLGDITRAGVLAAVAECQGLGRETFRRRYGFGRALTYVLVVDGDSYDSKAIAGVAHLYSVGALLSADDFSGGARTVAHRLRALGFTVEDGSTAADRPPQAEPQILLQPRGGARLRGAQNFAKSVHQGIRISDIQDVLGDQATTLNALYPDGIARLWGATPTAQDNNEKSRALRDRRVGDDVYFYTANHFFARARILHLFTSSPVARRVWGVDSDNATWEHIMALGDVEEFPTPVLAAPVLRQMNVPAPLWSLTLRSPESYRSVLPLLPAKSRPVVPSPLTPSSATATADQLTAEGLLERLGSLRTHRQPGSKTPSRHQPLALLWAISRISADRPRLTPWALFRTEVSPLLAEFGLPGSKVTPEYPFWHLRGSDLWEVHGMERDAGTAPGTGALDTHQPVAGLTHTSAELLRDPLIRLQAVIKLCSTYFDGVDQRELLNRVGLSGYATADGLVDEDEDADGQEGAAATERATGPTARRTRTSSQLVRDAAITTRVKELHGHACQICETRLQYKRRPYSEAAHIRGLGTPHNGPDELPNLLCLCPNHHVLFDGLEIYVDVDGVVKRTHGGKSVGRLRQHDSHHIDEAHLEYHRTLCDLNRWHAAE